MAKIEITNRKEIKGRLSLAEVFSNFIDGVKTNFAKGPAKQDRQLEMINPGSGNPFG